MARRGRYVVRVEDLAVVDPALGPVVDIVYGKAHIRAHLPVFQRDHILAGRVHQWCLYAELESLVLRSGEEDAQMRELLPGSRRHQAEGRHLNASLRSGRLRQRHGGLPVRRQAEDAIRIPAHREQRLRSVKHFAGEFSPRRGVFYNNGEFGEDTPYGYVRNGNLASVVYVDLRNAVECMGRIGSGSLRENSSPSPEAAENGGTRLQAPATV